MVKNTDQGYFGALSPDRKSGQICVPEHSWFALGGVSARISPVTAAEEGMAFCRCRFWQNGAGCFPAGPCGRLAKALIKLW